MRLVLLTLGGVVASPLAAQSWTALASGTTAEFRGSHAVDAQVYWAAGRGGVVAHTADGGATWRVATIPGAGQLFLVGVRALDARRAWVVGTAFEGAALGRIYQTDDGGTTWRQQYENSTAGVFLDGLTFWDARHGIAFGDPQDGKPLVLLTGDGGAAWRAVPLERFPPMLPGEASFAASGSAIVARPPGDVWIVTGGGAWARVLHSSDRGEHWQVYATPASGSAAKGLFGIAAGAGDLLVAVGGDYRSRDASVENLLRSEDGGRTWRVSESPGLQGVQYGVAHAGGAAFVAVGPGGSALSRDAGRSWTRLDGPGFNTVSCAAEICWAAGVDGRIARFRID